MTDLKLFRISGGHATELPSASMALEQSLQKLIEGNMDTLFGVRFLASEYSTGKVHGGRIDSLGLDENGSPVIFEYKRSTNENVINQGLFYLDWLLDHRAEFERLVSERIGSEAQVEWASPRLVCVANGFTRYDEHAVRQINRNIDLVRYRDFSGELFALELVTTVAGKVEDDHTGIGKGGGGSKHTGYKTVSDYLAQAPPDLKDLYASVDAFLVALGDDVQKNVTKAYIAFKRIKNFACVEVHPQTKTVLVFLKVDPATVPLENGFSRDVSNIGHFGTGNLELRLQSSLDFERAQPLMQRSYEIS
jgi:predicted transport protein